ncbi:hypothetical protein CTM_01125 [Clostridium tetanomorphum DSM 665]|nr:hypothetical protein CTM_01125 [Clostridium tetanomorphum DSM 665]NRZ96391.1 hypothetical protein [Clostridium tetanomorphum]
MEMIELLRQKLNELVTKETTLSRGEVLKLSQELDKLIYKYYSSTPA